MARTPSHPAPSASWQALFSRRSQGGGQPPAGPLYEQSVGNFIQAFIDPDNPLSPTRPEQVVQDMTGIWQEHGFLPLDELTMTLLRRYRPAASQKAAEALQQRLKSRYDSPEPLTGFQRKQYAPLVTGLAHLYAVTTGRNVTVVDGDMINMDATNRHFRALLAQREGIPVSSVPEEQAFRLTDKAMRVATGLTREVLQETVSASGEPHGQVLAFRYGGDEIRYICFGPPQSRIQSTLEQKALPAVEQFTAEAGLHDHVHVKHPLNRWRTGFGMAMTSYALNRNTRPGVVMHAAEKRLDEQKQAIGTGRRGRLSPQVLPARTHKDRQTQEALNEAELLDMAYHSGYMSRRHTSLTPAARRHLHAAFVRQHVIPVAGPELARADYLNLLQLELGHQLSERAAEKFRQHQSLKNGAGTLYPVQHPAMKGGDEFPAAYEMEPATAGLLLRNFDALLQRRYDRYAAPPATPGLHNAPSVPGCLFRKPHEREMLTLQQEWDRGGNGVDPVTRRMFSHVLQIFSPVDPSTGTQMGDVMPEIFGEFMADTRYLAGATRQTGLQAYGFRASMEGLAAINKKLGSQNANTILHHFANAMVLDSFRAYGFGNENVIAGHLGGAHLPVAVTPLTARGATTPQQLDDVGREITRRMQAFQQQPIAQFLREHGGTSPADLSESMTFGQLEDPKRAYCRGTEVTIHYIPLQDTDAQGLPVSGGANLTRLNRETEQKIDARRTERQRLMTGPHPHPSSAHAPRLS